MLAQCPALAHLDLSRNYHFGAAGAERLAGVLGQCAALTHLNLSYNQIGAAGAVLLGKRILQASQRTAERWLSHLHSAPWASALSAKGDFSFVAWSTRWPCFVGTSQVLALCRLLDRSTTRKGETACSAVSQGTDSMRAPSITFNYVQSVTCLSGLLSQNGQFTH